MKKKPLCLVTGGAGFIGSNLVDAILSKGFRVRVLDNLSTGTRENLANVFSRIEFLKGDLRSDRDVKKAVHFHLVLGCLRGNGKISLNRRRSAEARVSLRRFEDHGGILLQEFFATFRA